MAAKDKYGQENVGTGGIGGTGGNSIPMRWQISCQKTKNKRILRKKTQNARNCQENSTKIQIFHDFLFFFCFF
jgi:hypothetical protein